MSLNWYDEEASFSFEEEEAVVVEEKPELPLIKIGLVLLIASVLGGISKSMIGFISSRFKGAKC